MILRRSLLLLLLTGVGLINAGIGSSQSHPRVTVCLQGPPACDFAKIQEAIELAPPEATIEIGAGRYEEHLFIIGKSLTLLGSEGNVEVRGVYQYVPVITIEGDGDFQVRLERLSIVASDAEPAHGVLINAEDAQVTLNQLQVSNADSQGVLVKNARRVVIEESEFFLNGEGIVAENAKEMTVHNVLLYANGAGIMISGAGQTKLERVRAFANLGTGIVVSGVRTLAGESVIIQDSYIAGNLQNGISIYGAANARIIQSRIYANHAHGIATDDNSERFTKVKILNSTISANRFSGVYAGLRNQESELELVENVISRNREGWGVALEMPPCFIMFSVEGTVTGRKNVITENATVCPEELQFLMTDQGGHFP